MLESTEQHPDIRGVVARLLGEVADEATVRDTSALLSELATPGFVAGLGETNDGDIAVSLDEIRIGTLAELVEPLEASGTFSVVALPGVKTDLVLHADVTCIYALTDYFFGSGFALDLPDPERPLSQTEIDLMSMVFEQYAAAVSTQLEPGKATRPFVDLPKQKDAVLSGSKGEVFVALLVYRLTLPGASAVFSVALPQKLLLRHRPALLARRPRQASAEPEWKKQIRNEVSRSAVSLEATVRVGTLTLGEITRLKVGDVLPFELPGTANAELKAGATRIYRCEFGRSGNRYTVRVRDAISNEDTVSVESAAFGAAG